MAQFEFKQEPAHERLDWSERGAGVLGLAVRGCGLVLLLVGFVVALMVIINAWSLYNDPARIESFARAVEHGSGLDLTLSSAAAAARAELEPVAPDAGATAASTRAERDPELRFSYFVAWLIALLLLLLIGRLAIAAVKTGGELALYDVKLGRFAREIVKAQSRG
ncbi:MAG: hypothetical protein ACU85V_11945 [Gammaproteobacteria bacterium]